jgi:deoxyadenosine/deoxycytidine kinase
MQLVKLPDLLIYLRASVPHLVGNIQQRGRSYEQTISLEYLESLNRRYEHFVNNDYHGRVIILDKDHLDFQHRPQDLAQVIDRIDQTLFGLFPSTE